MKRRIIGLLLAIIILTGVSVSSEAFYVETFYYLEGIDMVIYVPENCYVLTRDMSESDPSLAATGFTQVECDKYLRDHNMYMDAISQDGNLEIVVTAKDTSLSDLNNMSDEETSAFQATVIGTLYDTGAAIDKLDFYQHNQAKFVAIDFTRNSDNEKIYGALYSTIYNNKALNITISFYDGRESNRDTNLITKIIDSVEIYSEPQNGNTTKDWKSTVKEYWNNSNTGTIASYLKPYEENDPEAKVIRAAFLSMEENTGEDYRSLIAELIDSGEDVAMLLSSVSKELFGTSINLSYNEMALNSYCNRDYSSAFSIAVYQAKRGSVFGRAFVGYLLLCCNDNSLELTRLNVSGYQIITWLQENINAGDPVAMYIMADINRITKRESEVNYYDKAAELFDVLAQGGSIPDPSKNSSDDYPDSTNWITGLGFTTANPLIQYFIGECYRFGDGAFPKDFEKAAEWYHLAADRGLPEACECYGHILLMTFDGKLFEDVGVDRFNECLSYLLFAAEHEKPAAQYDLALIYSSTGLAEREDDVDYWMRKAADNGYPAAQQYVEDGKIRREDWMQFFTP